MEGECWLTCPSPTGKDQTQHFEAFGTERKVASHFTQVLAIYLVELLAVQAFHA